MFPPLSFTALSPVTPGKPLQGMKFPVAERIKVGPLSQTARLNRDYITLGDLLIVPLAPHRESGGDEDAGVGEDSQSVVCRMLRTEIGTQ